jgi:hypothetical protein
VGLSCILGGNEHFKTEQFPITFTQQLIFKPTGKCVSGAVDSIKPNTFIHCTHGQDRTGLIVGEYRIRSCGWTKELARKEMKEYGFHPELFGLELFWEESQPKKTTGGISAPDIH